MGAERKCGSCGAWSTEIICPNCGADLDPKRIRVSQIRKKEEEKKAEEPQKLELFLMKWKASKNPFFKMTYWIGYSVWMVYMAILSFIAFMAAWGPG